LFCKPRRLKNLQTNNPGNIINIKTNNEFDIANKQLIIELELDISTNRMMKYRIRELLKLSKKDFKYPYYYRYY